MTTSSPPSSPLPTREQLDEIDALLRRMLTLPPLTGDVAQPPTTAFSATPPVSTATIREVPSPKPPAPEDPVVKSWRVEWPQPQASPPPSVVAWGSPVSTPAELPPWATASASAPAAAPAPPVPFATPLVAPPSPQPIATASPPMAEPAQREGGSFTLALLKLVNGVFDIVCFILGPLGIWLRGPGRNTIGWVGVAMILAAAVWAFGEWSGYDWPRPDLSRFGISR